MVEPVIKSLLDTDLYKLTMQAAVLDHFPDTVAEFGYTNRTPDKKFNQEAFAWIQEQVKSLANLRFSEDEIAFLAKSIPYLPKKYLAFLKDFKLDPDEQVELEFNDGVLHAKAKGLWKVTILYEIPLLAIISEGYFKFVETNWDYSGQEDLAANKAIQLLTAGCTFCEFGTRRRRSFKTQEIVIEGIIKGAKECGLEKNLTGTSNVYFAKKYNLKPIGTVAHEWMMGVAAVTQDYELANKRSMEMWIESFGGKNAGYALTDTFGSINFFKYFVPPFTDAYIGVRQDSGDPIEFTELAAQHYESLGYPKNSKRIIYSDSLNIVKCIQYKKAAEENGLIPTFGVGTFFTNNFKDLDGNKSAPLNIVIKIWAADGKPAIKISDNLGKNTGDPATVARVKRELGYVEHEWAEGDESKRW
ncbi:nicotinate phosphoribosyltransferase [Trichomonascus vanleenenianus]|uniref:nicotinate phosphoribosyltransferase n=1 Tax=Trichomonascus vanleenenianus TaxID=2268995 RepID=UPI003EC9690D